MCGLNKVNVSKQQTNYSATIFPGTKVWHLCLLLYKQTKVHRGAHGGRGYLLPGKINLSLLFLIFICHNFHFICFWPSVLSRVSSAWLGWNNPYQLTLSSQFRGKVSLYISVFEYLYNLDILDNQNFFYYFVLFIVMTYLLFLQQIYHFKSVS